MGGVTLRIDLQRVPEELQPGLREVAAERRDLLCLSEECDGRGSEHGHIDVIYSHDVGLAKRLAFTVAAAEHGRQARILYGHRAAAFRALGRLLGQLSTTHEGAASISSFHEDSRFSMLGVMVDASRNGVLRVEAAKRLLRHLALMGINTFLLYMEDTYEVPGRPFFGYLRGRYTRSELKALDDYAFNLGIEMIPCIQTLGHLEQILQWPAFVGYKDTSSVLVAEDEKTYQLLDEMLRAASSPFRSRRIHVGMDEAWGIGTGRYRQLHGEKRPFDVLNAHLARVREICQRQGLRPMIWSDMYFRIGSRTQDYYDKASVIPEDVKQAIPKDVDLVYWDYYHLESDFYADWIGRHRELGSTPVMAGGVWTWDRFWGALPFSFATTDACMRACKRQGLTEAFVTLWGDDGMECDIFSALPGIQFFAEHGYATSESIDQRLLRLNFQGACGRDADLDDWVKASEVDAPPGVEDPAKCHGNPGKWLLWQDPFLALMDPLVEGLPLREHYEQLAQALFSAVDKAAAATRGQGPDRAGNEGAFRWSQRLLLPAHLAQALVFKSELRQRLAAAYAKRDRAALRQMLATDIPALEAAVRDLWKAHRDLWMSTYKPFGWEVIEGRYGGLMARLATVSHLLRSYLQAEVEEIPELEIKLERPMEAPPGALPEVHYARVVTPSAVK